MTSTKYMDIKPPAKTELESFHRWANHMVGEAVVLRRHTKKIKVKTI